MIMTIAIDGIEYEVKHSLLHRSHNSLVLNHKEGTQHVRVQIEEIDKYNEAVRLNDWMGKKFIGHWYTKETRKQVELELLSL